MRPRKSQQTQEKTTGGWWFPWQVYPTLLAVGQKVHRKTLMKRPTSFGKRAKRLKARHRKLYGNWCPGVVEVDHPPHALSGRRYLTVDHIIPISKGGSHDRDNLRVVCDQANRLLDRREPL